LPATTTPPPVKELPSAASPAPPKTTTPPPTTMAQVIASWTNSQPAKPTPILHPTAKTASPPPGTVHAPQPEAAQARIETAPMSLLSTKTTLRAPGSTVFGQAPPTKPTAPVVVRSSGHPVPGKAPEAAGAATQATAPATATAPPEADGHERARRRARVILSDLTLYHREILLKAARAADAKVELGTLWRDAVISYNEAVPPDLRTVTNYLEEELERQLSQLRQA